MENLKKEFDELVEFEEGLFRLERMVIDMIRTTANPKRLSEFRLAIQPQIVSLVGPKRREIHEKLSAPYALYVVTNHLKQVATSREYREEVMGWN